MKVKALFLGLLVAFVTSVVSFFVVGILVQAAGWKLDFVSGAVCGGCSILCEMVALTWVERRGWFKGKRGI